MTRGEFFYRIVVSAQLKRSWPDIMAELRDHDAELAEDRMAARHAASPARNVTYDRAKKWRRWRWREVQERQRKSAAYRGLITFTGRWRLTEDEAIEDAKKGWARDDEAEPTFDDPEEIYGTLRVEFLCARADKEVMFGTRLLREYERRISTRQTRLYPIWVWAWAFRECRYPKLLERAVIAPLRYLNHLLTTTDPREKSCSRMNSLISEMRL